MSSSNKQKISDSDAIIETSRAQLETKVLDALEDAGELMDHVSQTSFQPSLISKIKSRDFVNSAKIYSESEKSGNKIKSMVGHVETLEKIKTGMERSRLQVNSFFAKLPDICDDMRLEHLLTEAPKPRN